MSDLATAAAALAALAPIAPRTPAPPAPEMPSPTVQGGPASLDGMVCPDGSAAGRMPVIDCGYEEVCATAMAACWDGLRYVPEGVLVGWVGERVVFERRGVGEGAAVAAWWPDGAPRRLEADGARHAWARDGSRSARVATDGGWLSVEVGPEGWLRSARRDVAAAQDGGWVRRVWWPDGSPRQVDADWRAAGPVVEAQWREDGAVALARRVVDGQVDGEAYVLVEGGYAVERWAAGELVDVALPAGFTSPAPVDGLTCPAGSWPQVAQGGALTWCETLSGVGRDALPTP